MLSTLSDNSIPIRPYFCHRSLFAAELEGPKIGISCEGLVNTAFICIHQNNLLISLFSPLGTDIIKKKLMEQNHNGQPHEEKFDFTQIEMQNHTPHQRSKSMMGRDGPNMSSTDSQGASRKTSAQADYNYLSATNPLLQSPNSLNPSHETVISNHTPHNRSPSLKIRRYSFLAGSRRGRGFSELFNSTILNDHFDQYSAQRDDSGLDKEYLAPDRKPHHPSDASPDSGVSEGVDDGLRTLQRRRTLPCIVKDDSDQTGAIKEQAHSSENLARKNPDTFIIENGIRKRVKGVTSASPSHNHSSSKGDLPKAYKIESQNKVGQTGNTLGRTGVRGSLPDITTIHNSDVKAMPREEAYRLNLAKREELRRLQELAERRRQGDVAVILGDLRVCFFNHCYYWYSFESTII